VKTRYDATTNLKTSADRRTESRHLPVAVAIGGTTKRIGHALQFVDNRQEAKAQRLIQQVANRREAIVQRVNKIPRPAFTREVINSIKLSHGEHRRHIVMSSRMREAIWAYHMSDGISMDARSARRRALQSIVGQSTLRAEMGVMTLRTHNSMGNLFPGKGSENTAIGFAVNPLYSIGKQIDEGTLKSVADVMAAVKKWHGTSIFGFARLYKNFIGEIVLAWLADKENHGNDPTVIGSAIQDFAFSCSFDFAYKEEGDEHGFPENVDADIQGKLLVVANTIEQVIQKPTSNIDLYGALKYLLTIAANKP
jgi:hypothetical protein